jgi:hypothetical protein
MRTLLLAAIVAGTAIAQQVDTRLSVHTLVREDIFAGFLANDLTRFARGEKLLEQLLAERPDQKASILAWQGGAALYRAVRAHEAMQPDQFSKFHRKALDLFAHAAAAAAGRDIGVAAVTGGSYSVLADRLPDTERKAAWDAAYENYQKLWAAQGASVEKLPLHMKGELLAGLAQSAQRTGRTEQMTEHMDKMAVLLPGTPYEARVRRWKANPEIASRTSLTCQTCHDAGKLENRRAALETQPAAK